MLPSGFRWAPRHQYDQDRSALTLDGVQVAMLLDRIDGGWFARLDCHHPMTAPMVRRRCTSLAAGRAGIEVWACRHEARLREEIAQVIAQSPRHRGAG